MNAELLMFIQDKVLLIVCADVMHLMIHFIYMHL